MLRLFSSRNTSRFLLCFETREKGVVVASDGRPASQLPVQLKLVALDVFGALGVVAVQMNVNQFPRVKHILGELNFSHRLS